MSTEDDSARSDNLDDNELSAWLRRGPNVAEPDYEQDAPAPHEPDYWRDPADEPDHRESRPPPPESD